MFETAVAEHRFVAILRGADTATLADRVHALHDAGVRLIEVALSDADAMATLQELVRIAPNDIVVGAGTVVSRDLADRAWDAGPTYLVTPHVVDEVLAFALGHELGIAGGVLAAEGADGIASAAEEARRIVAVLGASRAA